MESNLKRRKFIESLGMLSASTLFAERLPRSLSAYPGAALKPETSEIGSKLQPFKVVLPSHERPLPYRSNLASTKPGFSLRGIKGWAWSPEQYLDEIPIMAKYRLNFLMNDYGSLWELGPHGLEARGKDLNFWYRPLPQSMKQAFEKVIRSCQQNRIDFCFSVNPNVRSDRPFDYDNAEDFEALWQHYAWSQSLGVKWFNVSLDDIHKKIDAAGQARLANTLFQRLRQRDPTAQLAFCPTWYAGTGDTGIETNTTLGAGDTPGTRYTRTLGEKLHPDIFLFWTGPNVCSLTITAEHASSYKALSRHRILVWDNYPVNDQNPALHLGPLTGRSADLGSVVDGYLSNSMAYQSHANRIPLLTIADYLWNPKEYEPNRSIGQAIMHLGDTPEKREALCQLVELYPGRLWDKSTRTAWNSLRERFDYSLSIHSKDAATKLIARAQNTLGKMASLFPDPWMSGAEVLQQDVDAMTSQMSRFDSSNTPTKS